MLALSKVIESRLQSLSALAGWSAHDAFDLEPRKTLPSVVVDCVGAGARPGNSAAMVQVSWRVTLTVRRSATAAAELEPAMDAVVEALHGWMPPLAGGRTWEPLSLFSVLPPEYPESGLAGFALTFNTASMYRGRE